MPIYALGSEIARIHPAAFVHPQAVIIGEVHLGPGTSVWPSAVIRADNGPIVIGARTSVQDAAIIHTQPFNQTVVGDDCTIGHLAHLEGCVIEDLVMVGTGAIVLEQVVCRRGSFIAAGALVTPRTEVPSGAMAIGAPARIKLNAVGEDRIRGYTYGYKGHIGQQRNGTMREVTLEECLTDGTGDGWEGRVVPPWPPTPPARG
jgi:carbonic anhydrase/acetyltransferase-like protein (isoleucine patch superfamily)